MLKLIVTLMFVGWFIATAWADLHSAAPTDEWSNL
jgi:hypothetical protein